METIIPGKYIHYKGGEYEVLGIARMEATKEEYVIYKALYDSKEYGFGSMWLRPVKVFCENVIVDGKKVPRFKKV